MYTLKDFYVANVIKIEVKDKKITKYRDLGKTLVNYSGEDQINNEEKHFIVNANLLPEELLNFEITIDKNSNTATYLYGMQRFDLFLESTYNALESKVLFLNTLLNVEDVDLELLKYFFQSIIYNNYKNNSKQKLRYIKK